MLYPTHQKYQRPFEVCSADTSYCQRLIGAVEVANWFSANPPAAPVLVPVVPKVVVPAAPAKPSPPKVSYVDFRSSAKTVSDVIYGKQEIKRSTRLVIAKAAEVGGADSVGYDLAVNNSGHKIGIMVAVNSGLPAGDIGHVVLGHKNNNFDHYLNHGGQEENMVANWALTSCPTS
ncbi:MAG: hypothetical protein QS721_07130 [Candidatus Endonucleobacter sp. (ex Gigantidas childressi)]|nr:hypothetical protein [Candidatus Endonucleobacter sp. (ex Gigantidas childressi)]